MVAFWRMADQRTGLMRLLFLLVPLLAVSTWAQEEPAPLITYQEALRLARSQNENFLIAREQLEQARLLKNRAISSFLPVVQASGSYVHENKEIAFDNVVIQRQDYLAGTASISLTVFRASAIPGLLAASDQVKAAEYSTRWTLTQLSFEVAQAYFTALSSKRLLAAAVRSLDTAQELLDATQARRAAGEAIGLDVKRADVEVATARERVIEAENILANSLDYLAFLIGREPPLRVIIPPLEVTREDLSIQGREAAQRDDLRAAELNLKVAERTIIASWLEFLPTLAVSLNGAATQNTGFSGTPYDWNFALTLDWLIFNGDQRRIDLLERTSQRNVTRLEKELLQRTIVWEGAEARRNVETARASLATARERLEASQESYEMVLAMYRLGLANSLELVEANNNLRQDEFHVVVRELNLVLKALELLRVLGEEPEDILPAGAAP